MANKKDEILNNICLLKKYESNQEAELFIKWAIKKELTAEEYTKQKEKMHSMVKEKLEALCLELTK